MGKTAIGLRVCDVAATDRGEPAVFFSLEMDREEIADRLVMARARVAGGVYRSGHVSRDDEIMIGATYDAVRAGRLAICDSVGLTVSRMAALARRHKARHGLSLVAVDYVQLVSPESGRGASRQEEVAKISRDLKGMAKSLRVPVLALAQLNRAVEQREDHRPRMSDLRESGGLENDAHHVLLLHRPEYYDPNDHPGQAELIVAKNRSGATGTVRLGFVPNLMLFEAEPDGTVEPPVGRNGDYTEEPF
jgi:replicative DNA helicase